MLEEMEKNNALRFKLKRYFSHEFGITLIDCRFIGQFRCGIGDFVESFSSSMRITDRFRMDGYRQFVNDKLVGLTAIVAESMIVEECELLERDGRPNQSIFRLL